ncbi:MAG TPA: hypothetical protein VGN75_08470 [Kaistia sp.]|jgi:hypothetical protein|nr:hypothetical protein [Kaistia sp.]
MDLSDILGNIADQDRGKELELAHPVTGKPTGIKFRVAGPDSDVHRRARLALGDELAEMAGPDGRVTAEHREKAGINMLARCVLGWEIQEDGKPVPFSHKACVRVLSAGQWIRGQVDAFAGDRRNFAPEA